MRAITLAQALEIIEGTFASAERRNAWSPALPHHSIAKSSRPASVKCRAIASGSAAARSGLIAGTGLSRCDGAIMGVRTSGMWMLVKVMWSAVMRACAHCLWRRTGYRSRS